MGYSVYTPCRSVPFDSLGALAVFTAAVYAASFAVAYGMYRLIERPSAAIVQALTTQGVKKVA